MCLQVAFGASEARGSRWALATQFPSVQFPLGWPAAAQTACQKCAQIVAASLSTQSGRQPERCKRQQSQFDTGKSQFDNRERTSNRDVVSLTDALKVVVCQPAFAAVRRVCMATDCHLTVPTSQHVFSFTLQQLHLQPPYLGLSTRPGAMPMGGACRRGAGSPDLQGVLPRVTLCCLLASLLPARIAGQLQDDPAGEC